MAPVECWFGRETGQVIIVVARLDDEPLSEEAGALYGEALARFKTRCFRNANPPKSQYGLTVVHRRLQLYGDMEAWCWRCGSAR